MKAPAYNVFGTQVSGASAIQLAEWIESWARSVDRPGRVICFSDTHSIVQGHDNPAMRHALASADVVAADGHPIAWIGQRLHDWRFEEITVE